MDGEGMASRPPVPQGGLLVEVLLALVLLAISGTALVLLLGESLRLVQLNEQVSELLPPLSEWIVEATPGDQWSDGEGTLVRWGQEGWIRIDLLQGRGRLVRWAIERTPEEGMP